MTRQKQLVYGIIQSSDRHMTAEDIYVCARRCIPSMARGTVYRNLGQLTQEGRIGKLEMPGAPARYDRLSAPHPHLICQVCGGVEDAQIPDAAIRSLLAPMGTNITGYDLKLFYICPDCKSNQEENHEEHP